MTRAEYLRVSVDMRNETFRIIRPSSITDVRRIVSRALPHLGLGGARGLVRRTRAIATPWLGNALVFDRAPYCFGFIPGTKADEVESPDDLCKRLRQEIEQFFLNVDLFTHKHPRVHGWKGPSTAKKLLRRAKKAGRALR